MAKFKSQKIAIRGDGKSPDQPAISKFSVILIDIMEILKQGKVKRCKDSMKCDQNVKTIKGVLLMILFLHVLLLFFFIFVKIFQKFPGTFKALCLLIVSEQMRYPPSANLSQVQTLFQNCLHTAL